MLSALLGEFLPYILLAFGAVGGFFGYTRSVRKKAEDDTRNELHGAAVNEYVRNRKEIDDAKPVDTDAANARNRLRDRQAARND